MKEINANGHEYVDLGLPSCTLWATMNIGANSVTDYGDYFAWGETERKGEYNEDAFQDENYSWNDYKYGNGLLHKLTKYNEFPKLGIIDNKTLLDNEDDAAHVNWVVIGECQTIRKFMN